jgi:hypothetical protein
MITKKLIKDVTINILKRAETTHPEGAKPGGSEDAPSRRTTGKNEHGGQIAAGASLFSLCI